MQGAPNAYPQPLAHIKRFFLQAKKCGGCFSVKKQKKQDKSNRRFQFVQIVRPALHRRAARFEPFCAVVSAPQHIRDLMRQLRL